MTTMHKPKYAGLTIALGLALGLAACDREEVKEGVDTVARTKDEVAAELKEQLESAKSGAAEVKEELPSRAQVREQVAETAHDVKAVVKAAGAKVKEGAHEAREELREHTAAD